MESINVNKVDLLAAVKRNRDAHRGEVDAARERFRELAIERLDAMLADARAGKQFRMMLDLPVPEDHTNDYDAAISMLEMSIDDTVTVNESTYRQLVLNEWHWMLSYVRNTGTYNYGDLAKK